MTKLEIRKSDDGRRFVGKLRLSRNDLDALSVSLADIFNDEIDSIMLFDLEFKIDGECEFGTLEITEE